MKALIRGLSGILARRKKVEEPTHYESRDNSDLLDLIAKAKRTTEALPEPEKPVQLTLQQIKEIMDDHAAALKNPPTFANQEATIIVDGVDVVKIKSQNEGRYYHEAEMSLDFAAQVMANNMSTKRALDLRHERDTQAIGMGNIRKTGTMTDPQFHPNRTFNSPMEYENREMRRQREREEKRQKKRGKK